MTTGRSVVAAGDCGQRLVVSGTPSASTDHKSTVIRIASSLTNRIFIASTLLAIVSLGLAFYFVNARVSSEAEADLQRSVTEAATLVDLRRENLTDTFRTMARLVADIPKLKASMADADAATAQPIADEYRQLISADLLVLTDPRGGVLAVSGGDAEPILRLGDPARPLEEISTFVPRARGLLEAISVPVVTLDGDPPLIYGRLSVGFFMDDRLAARFKELTGTEVAFASHGKILASSLPRDARDTLSKVLDSPGITSITLGDQEYLCLSRPMPHDGRRDPAAADVPVMLVLQSRTARLSVLNSLRLGLAGALIITILLATLLSYFVARTVTRPLAAVTGAMGDVAATGDLTRKVPVRSRAWDDEDARLLASAFNTLTESIARFQKEAGQKERLSSLGRLSTVIAHEIRNPLMIIRATLKSLRRDHVSAVDRLDAVTDIDEETTRLNNLVSDVLDFAKPIRFELAPANLNDVCRASAAAAWAGHDDSEVQLDLDPDMPVAVTDAERMRTALINILTNARHAVHAAEGVRRDGASANDRKGESLADHRRGGSSDPPGGVAVASRPGVIVKTRYVAGRVAITIQDFGTGISTDDMGHIFDPYFTTRRKGTGLGLPIAKNIVDGLGGAITITSRLGEGTAIRLDLPLTAEAVS
jgi:signal transduction histidine kinase